MIAPKANPPSPARAALAAALDAELSAWADSDHPTMDGADLVANLLDSEAGRRALADVAAEQHLRTLAEGLACIAGNVQEMFTVLVAVLSDGANSEHPAGVR